MRTKRMLHQINQQFLFQAYWTKPLRDYLLKKINLTVESRILEIGCGTGVILEDFYQHGYRNLVGLDINFGYLRFARPKKWIVDLVNGDGFNLPYPQGTFNACLFHYFLLWVSPVDLIIKEAIRVLKDNGVIIALAEPDYLARIDYPPETQKISQIQNHALARSGADLTAGRKLKELFASNGLKNIMGGIFGQEWSNQFSEEQFNFEWNYLQDDLFPYLSVEEITKLKENDYQAHVENKRILFIPTFWAVGWV